VWVWGFLAAVTAIIGATIGTVESGIVCALIGGLFIGLAVRARQRARVRSQQRRDSVAGQIANAAERPEGTEVTPDATSSQTVPRLEAMPDRFALFLRPFSLTAELPVSNPNRAGVLLPSSNTEPGTIDLETILTEAFLENTPLIAFGRPGEAIGAGRIEVSDSDWRERLKPLAKAAAAIFVIPAASEGTGWEIEWLKSEALLAKCIFLMPPSTGSMNERAWRAAERALPISLPKYSSKGAIFSVDDQGRVKEFDELNLTTTRALVKSINKVARSPISEMLTSKFSEIPVVRAVAIMILCYFVLTLLECIGART
jgi:hypothetical protein